MSVTHVATDTAGAYAEYFQQPVRSGAGPLTGLSFAVKDNYIYQGRVAGNGNPLWKATHSADQETAPAVRLMLAAGAALNGFTLMEELAFSITGINAHYGTPLNSAAPDRVPGGSSSGSASAVAARLADFALGSDTGGSVRVPASFCGLYGLRPTHGRIDGNGLLPLAASFDVPGWFTRDLDTLLKVSASFGIKAGAGRMPDRLWLPDEVWARLSPEVRETFAPVLSKLETLGIEIERSALPGLPLEEWLQTFRTLQSYEAWQANGDWITREKPEFGPGVGARFEFGSKISEKAFQDAAAHREAIRAEMDTVFGAGTVLVIPSAPGPAPRIDTLEPELDAYRAQTMCLTCISGLNSYPELSVPGLLHEGAPIGLSLIAPRLRDQDLLALAAAL
ncbi:amidase [Roseibium suaedae]|uniref:Amidase n=1 Tax=Roseibium suaedae TaxID=735517 RepID=A0A1M7KVG1_9HYPH|nr:amidase [Roseibium suaedae]SHM69521.1 amidase [Roseibium suaedae]